MASPWASLLNVPGYADLLDIDEEGRRFGRIYAVGIGDIASAGPVFHTSKIGSITLKVKFFSFDLSNQKIYHNNLFIRDSDRVGYVSYMEVNVAEDGDGLISMKRMLPVSETAPEQSKTFTF